VRVTAAGANVDMLARASLKCSVTHDEPRRLSSTIIYLLRASYA